MGEKKNLYQYDGASDWYYNYVESGESIANVFTVSAPAGLSEEPEAITLSLSDTNVNYSLQEYTDITDPSNPLSGTAALSAPQTGTIKYAGYYTINLDEAVSLAGGSSYSAVLTLSHRDGSRIEYNVDVIFGAWRRYSENTDWVHFESKLNPNQSFEMDYADGIWDDLASSSYDDEDEPGCCTRIKAITIPAEKIPL